MKYLYRVLILVLCEVSSFAMEKKETQKPLSRSSSSTDLQRLADKNATPEAPIPPELLQQTDTKRPVIKKYISVDMLVHYLFPVAIEKYDFDLEKLKNILTEMPIDIYNENALENMPFLIYKEGQANPEIDYEMLQQRPMLAHRFQVLRIIIDYLATKTYSTKEAALEEQVKKLKETIQSYLTKEWDTTSTEKQSKEANQILEQYDDIERALGAQKIQSIQRRSRIIIALTMTGYLGCFACALVASYYALHNSQVFRANEKKKE